MGARLCPFATETRLQKSGSPLVCRNSNLRLHAHKARAQPTELQILFNTTLPSSQFTYAEVKGEADIYKNRIVFLECVVIPFLQVNTCLTSVHNNDLQTLQTIFWFLSYSLTYSWHTLHQLNDKLHRNMFWKVINWARVWEILHDAIPDLQVPNPTDHPDSIAKPCQFA